MPLWYIIQTNVILDNLNKEFTDNSPDRRNSMDWVECSRQWSSRSGEAKHKPLSSEPPVVPMIGRAAGQACNLQHLAKGPCVFASSQRCARFELLYCLIVLWSRWFESSVLSFLLYQSSTPSTPFRPPLFSWLLVLGSRLARSLFCRTGLPSSPSPSN